MANICITAIFSGSTHDQNLNNIILVYDQASWHMGKENDDGKNKWKLNINTIIKITLKKGEKYVRPLWYELKLKQFAFK